MDIKDLARIDLNMLVALEALLEERSVSKAAERLFVTQSAMSKTLGRLRNLFDDPLFTRTYAGMQPTPRAEEIEVVLPAVLQALKCLVQPAVFDPANYQGEFSMVIPDYVAGWMLPALYCNLSKQAPGVRIRHAGQVQNQLEALAAGKLDFMVHIALQEYPPDFEVKTVGFAPPNLFIRKGHPLEGTQPSWDEIEKYPQIELHYPDKISSEAYKSMRYSAFVKHLQEKPPQLVVENVFIALRVTERTDGIFLGPPLSAELMEQELELTTLPFPNDEDITLRYTFVQHERIMRSAPHQYIGQQILDCIEAQRIKMGLPNFADLRQLHDFAY